MEAYQLARSSDPSPSHTSAEEAAEFAGRMQKWAAARVALSPGKTARELAAVYCPTDPRKIGRRLNECEKLGTVIRGQVRRCSISGRPAATWFPPDHKET